MLHLLVAAVVIAAVGFGLGRIKNLKHAEAKVKADEQAIKNELKKL